MFSSTNIQKSPLPGKPIVRSKSLDNLKEHDILNLRYFQRPLPSLLFTKHKQHFHIEPYITSILTPEEIPLVDKLMNTDFFESDSDSEEGYVPAQSSSQIVSPRYSEPSPVSLWASGGPLQVFTAYQCTGETRVEFPTHRELAKRDEA